MGRLPGLLVCVRVSEHQDEGTEGSRGARWSAGVLSLPSSGVWRSGYHASAWKLEPKDLLDNGLVFRA